MPPRSVSRPLQRYRNSWCRELQLVDLVQQSATFAGFHSQIADIQRHAPARVRTSTGREAEHPLEVARSVYTVLVGRLEACTEILNLQAGMLEHLVEQVEFGIWQELEGFTCFYGFEVDGWLL